MVQSPAEGQALFDAIHVRGVNEGCLTQRSAALGAFALLQVASAGAAPQDLAVGSDLETFGHRFSGFVAFGSSHTRYFRHECSEILSALRRFRESLSRGRTVPPRVDLTAF